MNAMTPLTELSPQERLALSRKALVQHMSRHRPVEKNKMAIELEASEPPAIGSSSSSASAPVSASASSGQTWNLLKYAARNWWYRHPASAAAGLAQPLLRDYAQAHPFKLLLISAGVGAAAVMLRPWRLVSVGLLLSAVKSSGLPGALLSDARRSASQRPLEKPPSRP